MNESRSRTLSRVRVVVVVGVLVVMPILAIPAVNQNINRWLRPEEGADSSGAPNANGDPSSAGRKPRDSAEERLPAENQSSILRPGISRLEELTSELRRLGVEKLELAAEPHPPYGFHVECEVPMPTNPIYRRSFEARGVDEGAALEELLVQIRAWRRALKSEPRPPS